MRKRGLLEIFNLAKKNNKIIFLGSDLGHKTLDDFKEACPNQFYMEGISEQNIVGMAAGLAQEGKIVYINTIATFLTRRCFDQIAMDVATGNHNVRLYANGGGVVYAPLGPTHLAVDDIALMRSIPGMTIVHPSDSEEMARLIKASEKWQGPIYIRLCRGGETQTSQAENGFEIGKAITLKESGEITICATGVMVYRALEVAKKLEEEFKIQVGVINIHSIAPLDKPAIEEAAKRSSLIVTFEEHNITGGLGSAVGEVLSESLLPNRPSFKRYGFPDCYPDKYGQQDLIISHYGLDTETLTKKVSKLYRSLN